MKMIKPCIMHHKIRFLIRIIEIFEWKYYILLALSVFDDVLSTFFVLNTNLY